MLSLIISSLYFILPAYFANMCPVIFGRFKIPVIQNFPLSQPINENLFGAHKTWKGFYLGYLGALLVLVIQFYLQKKGITTPFNELFSTITATQNYPPSPQRLSATLLDYENTNLFLYAFLFGIGALSGDLIKSFFKRRLGIKPGQSWFPFDQLDFVIGALILLAPFYITPWTNILTILIITPLLHLLTNITAYILKIKKVWW